MAICGRWRRVFSGWLLALGAACASACGAGGSSVRTDPEAPQIGLQRGGHWSVLTIKPPYLTGPLFHLTLKDGKLTGSSSGGMAPGGSLNIRISKDGAEGKAPLGTVAMDFIETADSTIAEGLWNGQRVHLVFTADSVRGTVAENSDSMSFADPELRPTAMPNRRTRALIGSQADLVHPNYRNVSCEYHLDKRTQDGALVGGSTCAGMPQPTRLEVPAQAETWLTRSELVTILVAVLSAPPAISAEAGNRRIFDGDDVTAPIRR